MKMKQRSILEMIDLLVDGELDEAKRTHLLGLIDQTPGAWKRCAMVFLENQDLKKHLFDFNTTGEKTASKYLPPLDRPEMYDDYVERGIPLAHRIRTLFRKERSSGNGAVRGSLFKTLTALAGCLLVGFGIGVLVRESPLGVAPSNDPGMQGYVATDNPATENQEPAPVMQYADYEKELRSLPEIPGAMRSEPQLVQNIQEMDPRPQLRLLPIQTAENQTRNVYVPCFDNKTVDLQSLRENIHSSKRDMIRNLRSAGHEVGIRRQHFVLKGSNGELILVPVEDIIIRYSDTPLYE